MVVSVTNVRILDFIETRHVPLCGHSADIVRVPAVVEYVDLHILEVFVPDLELSDPLLTGFLTASWDQYKQTDNLEVHDNKVANCP